MAISWAVGSPCWAPDEERAFVAARVDEVSKTKSGFVVTVTPENVDLDDGDEPPKLSKHKYNAIELLPRAKDQMEANMDNLQVLNEAEVLSNIVKLYSRERVYTSVGPVLVAMNPCATLEALYRPEVMASYRKDYDSLAPHCYKIAEIAFQGLRAVRNQSIVICGESGAGKTVTSRKILEYLCAVPQHVQHNASACPISTAMAEAMRRTKDGNALLESFGNARTVRNKNSSRFGRYTKILHDCEKYAVRGCTIDHYLLERSRVVLQPQGERNYHIFHQVFHSTSGELGLDGGPTAFAYTASGSGLDAPEFDTSHDFEELLGRLRTVGLDQVDAGAKDHPLLRVVAGILHLGNIAFTSPGDSGCEVAPDASGTLQTACSLLGLPDPNSLGMALRERFIKLPGESQSIRKPLDVCDAVAQRDAVAKTIYSCLFDWLVSAINKNLVWNRPRLSNIQNGMSDEAVIGLLDIFGFEDMPVNGFEQMYINLTNERIQHLFGQLMLQRELEFYEVEGVQGAFDNVLDVANRWDCIELFTKASKPPGIIKQLADLTMRKGNEDKDIGGASIVTAFNAAFNDTHHYTVCTPTNVREAMKHKQSHWRKTLNGKLQLDYRECFQVEHYVGPVVYTVREFVQKSRDTLNPHLLNVLRSSQSEVVNSLFASDQTCATASSSTKVREKTVGERFCVELDVLIKHLEQGTCRFVRCIKPNADLIPLQVDRPMVRNQLICGGVIAALEIRNSGFPDRMEYNAFLREFAILEPAQQGQHWNRRRPEQRCRHLLERIRVLQGRYAFGKSMLCMKDSAMAFLRNVVGVLETRSANRLRRQWRIRQGTVRIRDIENIWRRHTVVVDTAHEESVSDWEEMSRVLAVGKIEAAHKQLENAKMLHPGDVQSIGLALNQVHMQDLRGSVEDEERVLKIALAQKMEVKEDFVMQLDRARQRVADLVRRMEAVEATCQNEECHEACDAARRNLDRFMQELARLQQVGPQLIDPVETVGRSSIDPRCKDQLDTAVACVAHAEECQSRYLAQRSAFTDTVKTALEAYNKARDRLRSLEEEAQQCIGSGLSMVGDAMDNAQKLDAKAQEVCNSALDARAFADAVDEFVSAVEFAEESVEQGRDARAWKSNTALNSFPLFEARGSLRGVRKSVPPLGILTLRCLAAHGLPCRRRGSLMPAMIQRSTSVYVFARLGHLSRKTDTVGIAPEIAWDTSELIFNLKALEFKLELVVFSERKGSKAECIGQVEINSEDLHIHSPGQWHRTERELEVKDNTIRPSLEFEVRFDRFIGRPSSPHGSVPSTLVDHARLAEESLTALLGGVHELRGTQGQQAAQQLHSLTSRLLHQVQVDHTGNGLASVESSISNGHGNFYLRVEVYALSNYCDPQNFFDKVFDEHSVFLQFGFAQGRKRSTAYANVPDGQQKVVFSDEQHIFNFNSDPCSCKIQFTALKHYVRKADVRIGEADLFFSPDVTDCKPRRIELQIKPDKPNARTTTSGIISLGYQLIPVRP